MRRATGRAWEVSPGAATSAAAAGPSPPVTHSVGASSDMEAKDWHSVEAADWPPTDMVSGTRSAGVGPCSTRIRSHVDTLA